MKEAHRVRRAIPARAIEFEELVGFGYVGMVEAQSRFENSRGTNIETLLDIEFVARLWMGYDSHWGSPVEEHTKSFG